MLIYFVSREEVILKHLELSKTNKQKLDGVGNNVTYKVLCKIFFYQFVGEYSQMSLDFKIFIIITLEVFLFVFKKISVENSFLQPRHTHFSKLQITTSSFRKGGREGRWEGEGEREGDVYVCSG